MKITRPLPLPHHFPTATPSDEDCPTIHFGKYEHTICDTTDVLIAATNDERLVDCPQCLLLLQNKK